MSAVLSTKMKYTPSLLERLKDEAPHIHSDRQPLRLVAAEEVKESVARDLEALLNCRRPFNEEALSAYPESARSMCSYGMSDFVGLSLANPADRNFICESLERTISIHERRLRNVNVTLELDDGSVNRLRFAIHALLVIHPSTEPVSFDALLQPSTCQYSVTKARRSS